MLCSIRESVWLALEGKCNRLAPDRKFVKTGPDKRCKFYLKREYKEKRLEGKCRGLALKETCEGLAPNRKV